MLRTRLYRAVVCALSLVLLLQAGVAAAGNSGPDGWNAYSPDDGDDAYRTGRSAADNWWDNQWSNNDRRAQQTGYDPADDWGDNRWSDNSGAPQTEDDPAGNWWDNQWDGDSDAPQSGDNSAGDWWDNQWADEDSGSPQSGDDSAGNWWDEWRDRWFNRPGSGNDSPESPAPAPSTNPETPPSTSPEPSTAPTEPSPSPSTQPSPSPSTKPSPSPSETPASGDLASQAADLLNKARAEQGLQPLTRDPGVDKVAAHRSQDMADRNYFSHTTPDGTDVYDELKAAGIAYTAAGEIIAQNTYPVDQAASVAVKGWLNSPGHRAIMLDPNYTKFGVGAATDSNGMHIFTGVYLR